MPVRFRTSRPCIESAARQTSNLQIEPDAATTVEDFFRVAVFLVYNPHELQAAPRRK